MWNTIKTYLKIALTFFEAFQAEFLALKLLVKDWVGGWASAFIPTYIFIGVSLIMLPTLICLYKKSQK